MEASEIKEKYIEFFKKKGHKEISNASLIPENDPTVLFTPAGMHPLIPYLIGEKHPQGKRLVNCQKCIRTIDIDEVGDNQHLTFFEMLGNWSLGDYFKEEAIEWSYEFLTKILKLDSNKLYVSVFKGDKDAPKDTESAGIWKSLGIPDRRIFYFDKKSNWWGLDNGPCGPDSEMFYWIGEGEPSENQNPTNCKDFVEIWNDVFMEYNKQGDKLSKLKQKNVDTGFGLERAAMILQGKNTIFETELFINIIDKIKKRAKVKDERAIRIIADHLKAATFILAEGVVPSNIEQGYILRRFIRRSVRYGRKLGINHKFCSEVVEIVIEDYKKDYPYLLKNKKFILDELQKEEFRFDKALNKGLRIFEQEIKNLKGNKLKGETAFILFSTYGFPFEMTEELAKEKGIKVDREDFEEAFKEHQETSRKATKGKFKGGLADQSDNTVRLHTAAHLLLAALRKVLDKNINQKGSNINPERLRFDFNYPQKISQEQLKEIEDLVNKKIQEEISVNCEEMSLNEAKKKGAMGVFEHKYGDKVKVYSVDNFSKEICGGPHVKNTKELSHFKIIKEDSIAAGVRRIKAVLD